MAGASWKGADGVHGETDCSSSTTPTPLLSSGQERKSSQQTSTTTLVPRTRRGLDVFTDGHMRCPCTGVSTLLPCG
ncbi:unnamed protein product, partial [Amoebophrya sp. A25]|eukprot:GSA25T00018172001.1